MDDDDPIASGDLSYRHAVLRSTLNLIGAYLELGWVSESDQEILKERIDRALEADGSPKGPDY